MLNTPFFNLLPFAEFCIQINKDILLLEGHYDTLAFNTLKFRRVLNLVKDQPYWIEFNEISNISHDGSIQIDLLGNLKEPCLLLRSTESLNQDIYLIKFKVYEDVQDIYYGKDQKFLIELIVKGWIDLINNPSTKEHSHDDTFLHVSLNQLLRIDNLNHKYNKIQLQLSSVYKQLLLYFLREKIGVNESLELSNSALDYLQTSEVDYDVLEQLSLKAFEIAKTLNPNSLRIIIEADYFISNIKSDVSNKIEAIPEQKKLAPLKPSLLGSNPITPPLQAKDNTEFKTLKFKRKQSKNLNISGDSKINKTIKMLNRYEEAVQLLILKNVPIMGKNISSVCVPPISAPALTDSINKHHDRIINCLKQYPEMWIELRKQYLPILKLVKALAD